MLVVFYPGKGTEGLPGWTDKEWDVGHVESKALVD